MVSRGLVIVAAVVIPLGVSCVLGAYAALWRMEQGLQAVATTALVRAESVVGRVRASLDGYRPVIGERCDETLVARFRRDLKDDASLHHMGLFAPDLTVHCSDGGRRSFPLIAGSVPATTGDRKLMLASQKAVLDDEGAPVSMVVLAVRGPQGDGAFAMMDAGGLLNGAVGAALSPGQAVTLRLANGVPVIQVPPSSGEQSAEWLGLGPVRTERRSDWVPLAVEAAAGGEAVARMVRRSLAISLPAGLLLGLGAGVAAVRGPLGALRLRSRLRRAVRAGEIEVHYQPIIRLADDRCVGAEALMRWRHPRAGFVEPESFLPMVERGGGIITLTRYVMRRVADDLPRMTAVLPEVQVSINLVAVHLEASTLGEDVLRIFTAVGLTRHIVFEATERQLITDEAAAETCIRQLHEAGVRVYLDDFGTGHSSLAYLQRFPVDGIKIAQRFVSEIGTEAPQRSVIDAIINLGQSLHLAMIAEGIETEEQAVYLKDAAVGFGQGYYWAPPLPLAGFLAYLRADRESAED